MFGKKVKTKQEKRFLSEVKRDEKKQLAAKKKSDKQWQRINRASEKRFNNKKYTPTFEELEKAARQGRDVNGLIERLSKRAGVKASDIEFDLGMALYEDYPQEEEWY